MSLSSAFSIITSSFATNAAQTAIVSNNIANANTPGYAREVANVVADPLGGADIASVTRQTNGALQAKATEATSLAAGQQAIADGLATLAQTVNDSASTSATGGALANGASPSAMLANLQSALRTYAVAPNNSSAAQAAVSAASDLAGSLRSASAATQQARSQADAGIASAVTSINSLLDRFAQANASIVAGSQSGTDTSGARDTRDTILAQLAHEIGISTVQNPNGSMSIYTDSGVTLFQETARTVAFTPTATLTAGAAGNSVIVNGVPVTGAGATMPVHAGAIAGLATLRDTLAPQYQAQLDQLAGGLVNAFAESDQSQTPSRPPAPGLFTVPGATGLPAANAVTGFAASIEVNANVDPARGGTATLLRDGGISSPGSATYTYNSTGAAGYSGRIQELLGQITTVRGFGASGGIDGSTSLADYANGSVSWLQAQNQQASARSTYQSALATQATSALSNAVGVNLDAEMIKMLSLENSYTTTAKLLTTVNSMFTALMNAA
jgi:flagellar hook-associated protein 1 FlgK